MKSCKQLKCVCMDCAKKCNVCQGRIERPDCTGVKFCVDRKVK